MTKASLPTPVVVNPDGCIDHCRGCQSQCPAAAISYVGDDGGGAMKGGCGCGGGSCCG
jgi:NAD-dependent dihydropyrimidine dehydrogenase PreA subunit